MTIISTAHVIFIKQIQTVTKKKKVTTGTYETMTIGGRNNDKYTGWNYLDITFEDELPSGDYIIEVKTDGKNKFTKDLSFTIE